MPIAGSTQGIRFLDTPLDNWFECPNTSRSCYRLGAKLGSHSAKSRQESGGVWTVICPGKQHFANLLDSSRPARGLLHTEEVTGSIPVSPTRSEAYVHLYQDRDGSHSCNGQHPAGGPGTADRRHRAVPLREFSAATVRSALKDLAATRATRTLAMMHAGSRGPSGNLQESGPRKGVDAARIATHICLPTVR